MGGKQKEVPPLYISILLFITSLVTLCIVIGMFFWGLFRCLFWKTHSLSKYLSDISISIDQTDNVLGQHFFNDTFIKRTSDKNLLFGNMDETISSNIGENQKENNLTKFGIFWNKLLDWLDPNHSIDAIEEDEI